MILLTSPNKLPRSRKKISDFSIRRQRSCWTMSFRKPLRLKLEVGKRRRRMEVTKSSPCYGTGARCVTGLVWSGEGRIAACDSFASVGWWWFVCERKMDGVDDECYIPPPHTWLLLWIVIRLFYCVHGFMCAWFILISLEICYWLIIYCYVIVDCYYLSSRVN